MEPPPKPPLGAPAPPSSALAPLCVAIVCARYAEAEAVRRVFEKQTVVFKEAATKSKYLYHHAIFTDEHCSIKLAVISAEVMGSKNMNIVRDVLDEFAPQWLIMTGMCAGRRGEVSLGDIVVADSAIDMNAGKRGSDGKLGRALDMISIDKNLSGFISAINADLKKLPLPVTEHPLYKREVIFRLLYDNKEKMLKPAEIIERAQKEYGISFANGELGPLMKKLIDNGKELKKQEGGMLALTDEKQSELEEEISFYMRQYPSAAPKGHLGPYAVDQSAVVSNLGKQEWKALAESIGQRKLLALDMECVAVYEAARHYNEAHPERHVKFLVVKAVVDFADVHKDDSFQRYGAELSAAWAFVFIKRYAAKACGTAPPVVVSPVGAALDE